MTEAIQVLLGVNGLRGRRYISTAWCPGKISSEEEPTVVLNLDKQSN